jgi:hypothetical protein
MSHFVIAVFCNDPNEIKEKLAPFVEEVSEGDEYAEFCDCTEEAEAEWKKKGGSDNPKEIAAQKALGTFGGYENIDDLANRYFGYIMKDGRYGYFHNPNTQWDWYAVGGRWSGELAVKSDVSKRCNSAKIKDIDFDRMSAESGEKQWRTFAMLNLDGEWYDQGKMCWWGMSDGTLNSVKAFIEHFYKYIESVDPNTYLVIVDCHI